MRCCIIIPARFQASRFPGKLLEDLNGLTVLQHVYHAALKSEFANKVIVATDDTRIMEHCEQNHMDVIMTRSNHISGTDRVAEAYQHLDTDFDFVINIQGDEPFVTYKEINTLINILTANKSDIATLYSVSSARSENNPNEVKLVTDIHRRVLYFSRSSIPHRRDGNGKYSIKYHVGMYGFRPKALLEVTQLKESPLESLEKLEQLRWMENGYEIYASEVDYHGFGIDTPKDLDQARKLLS